MNAVCYVRNIHMQYLYKNQSMPAPFDATEFIKQKHGRITIIKELPSLNKRRRVLCKCDCGKVWEVTLRYIKSGQIKSCGCYKQELRKLPKTHGMGGRKNRISEYKVWASMIQRCTNQKEDRYKDYGGRGITVCERWRLFINFLADMGFRPSKHYSLDRIENDKGYYKENCRWATMEMQQNNRRTSRVYEYKGRKLNVKQWALETGINLGTLKNRFKNPNWDIEKSLTHPIFYR
jgi:hypothetical protein